VAVGRPGHHEQHASRLVAEDAGQLARRGAAAAEPDQLGGQAAVAQRELVDAAVPAEADLVATGAGKNERAFGRFHEGQ
jgi:hypothetical protein